LVELMTTCTQMNNHHYYQHQQRQLSETAASRTHTHTHTHTHTRARARTHPFNAICPGLPRLVGTRKVKPIWILLKQQTVSGSSISWAVCKFAPRSRQITTPAPRHSVFLQAGCPSCRPTNSVKALKTQAASRTTTTTTTTV